MAAPWLRRGAFVALVAGLIWVAHFDCWTPARWSAPTDYVGDAHETLARLKAAAEGDIVPLKSQVIARLGAPFGAHWNAYPTPDKPLMLALGAAVHAFGIYAAANLGLMLAQVTAALAFYFTARWLRCRWEWAAAGALLFAYTYHTFHRGLAHFSLVFTWTVPLGLLAVWLIAGSKRLAWRRPGAWVCLAAAAGLGVSNPYNLFFWLQLLGWALVLQLFGPRRRENLQIGVAALGVALAAFVAMHAEGWLHADDTEALPLLARNYSGTERYALKPVEMFIPPIYHKWDWLAFFGHRYSRWAEWRGEEFLPYLGLAGIAGFVWLAVVTIRRIVRRRPLPGQALSVGWIVAYSSIGGLTNILALFIGFQLFRATNRAAIFVSALVLCFLAVRLSRATSAWPRWRRFGAAALVAGIGVSEQLPRREGYSDRDELAQAVAADAAFGRALEAGLPRGAMVFQLPVMGFPEIVPPHRLSDYEHFRPYLVTETLRFSYGAPKTRARSRWQRDLEGLPTAEVVRRLESYGFGALYLNRKGYKDNGESLLAELAALGYTERIVSRLGNQVAIPLRPAAEPRPPLGREFTIGQGWHMRPDAGVRWAYADAALSYFNPYPHPLAVDLRITLVGVSPRPVVLAREGEILREMALGETPRTLFVSQVTLAPGVNRFRLSSPEPATRAGAGSHRQLRTFGLRRSTVTPSASKADRPPAGNPLTAR
jgi:phosphoglycerol transferase